MKRYLTILSLLVVLTACQAPSSMLIEAESFADKGGWSTDQQFTFEMGSPYLIAHGMGVAVEDASTEVNFKQAGDYHVYVRTYNWTSKWSDKRGAGLFQIGVGDELLNAELVLRARCGIGRYGR